MAIMRQTIKISALDAARGVYFIIVGLAVRSALLFMLYGGVATTPQTSADALRIPPAKSSAIPVLTGVPEASTKSSLNSKGTSIVNTEDVQHSSLQQPPYIPFGLRLVITAGFLFTAFRFTHGIAVVYEMEKKKSETETTPSSKKVELIFGLFILEAIGLFLMAEKLGTPKALIASTAVLLLADLMYVIVSKTLKDANLLRLLLPWYWVQRWKTTVDGYAPRAHLQWAVSDILLLTLLLLSGYLPSLAIGNISHNAMWAALISMLLIVAGLIDYEMNGLFYFSGKRHKKRKCVFVCSPLKAPSGTPQGKELEVLKTNIRNSQWYCRKMFDKKLIPFASHAFYPYFLDDNKVLERKLAQKCALEFLVHCDALYLYTEGGHTDEQKLSQGMKEELKTAKQHGLEIKFFAQESPQDWFQPNWAPLMEPEAKRSVGSPNIHATEMNKVDSLHGNGENGLQEIDLEVSFKKVFVCTQLRGKKRKELSPEQQQGVFIENIRLTQWLCQQLMKSPEGERCIAAFAPQAFYPYFTDYDEKKGRLTWLDSAIDVMKICDALYVYTENGLEDETYLSDGMLKCIAEARELGMEVKFRRITYPTIEWIPASWKPARSSESNSATAEIGH